MDKMEDLLQSQIRDSCRLALPEGLKDLMCDISREVLRAQPADLYNFIVEYLSALLLARDALSISCRVYCEICEGSCQPELDGELRNIGLEGVDLETAKNVVMEYFDKGEAVKEENLLMRLLRKTSIAEDMLPAVQNAVRTAYMKHHLDHQDKLKKDRGETVEKGEKAAKNTMKFHEKTDDIVKEKAASILQPCVRGHLVRYKGSIDKLNENGKVAQVDVDEATQKEPKAGTSRLRNGTGRLSSTSLAGSLIHLPKFVPYSAHELTYAEFEERETERSNIDYTRETLFKDQKTSSERKKIEFHQHSTLYEIESCSIEPDEKEIDEDCVEEEIVDDDIESVVSSIDDIAEEKSFNDVIACEAVPAVDEEVDDQVDTVDEIIEEELPQHKIIHDYISLNGSEEESEQTEPKKFVMVKSQVLKDKLLIPTDNHEEKSYLPDILIRASPKMLSFENENITEHRNEQLKQEEDKLNKTLHDKIKIIIQDPKLEYIEHCSVEAVDHPCDAITRPIGNETRERRSNDTYSDDNIFETTNAKAVRVSKSNKTGSDEDEVEIRSNFFLTND